MIAKHDTLFDNNAGFTLIELMVAMVMAAIVIISTMTIAEMSARSYEAQERVSTAQQGVRAAMDMMVRDIRMAGYDPMAHSNGSLPDAAITTASPTVLEFGADLDASGAIDTADEKVRFNFAGGRLQMQKLGGATPWPAPLTLINGVETMNFDYWDEDGKVPANLDEIVMVVVTMKVRATDSRGKNYDRTLTTRINCRNLRI
jgi:type IV pilus assembly protein PilW